MSVVEVVAVSEPVVAGSAGALALVAGGVAGALVATLLVSVATLLVSVAAPAGVLVPALSEPALHPAMAKTAATLSIAISCIPSAFLSFHNFICVHLSLWLMSRGVVPSIRGTLQTPNSRQGASADLGEFA